jgi:hypothetical protein
LQRHAGGASSGRYSTVFMFVFRDTVKERPWRWRFGQKYTTRT